MSTVTVIAGGAIELGRACVLRAARPGDVVLVIDADAAAVEAVCAEATAQGARAIPYVAEADDLTALAGVGEALAAEADHCDGLVNCQFAFDMSSVTKIDIAEYERVVRANLTAPVVLVQALLPLMQAAPAAAVVNVGTIDGIQGNPWLPAYSASKGGLVALTHVLAHDLGQHGIRANYVARCGTKEMKAVLEAASGDPLRPDWEERLSSFTPLGRIGSADETAAVVEYLLSEGASFVSGSVITVDGGRTGITPGTI